MHTYVYVKYKQDPVSLLGVLQLRRVLRALGLQTAGSQAQLADRLREALVSGSVSRFAREKRAAACSTEPSQCGE